MPNHITVAWQFPADGGVMSKLLKCLLAATAFLTLAPTAASALPPQCDYACDYTSYCSQKCALGSWVVPVRWRSFRAT
jgi:hypothetical protein